MFYSYSFVAVLSLLANVIWFFKIRKISLYEGTDEIDDFGNVDNGMYDKLDKFKRLKTDFLFILLLIYGILALYNAVATLVHLPVILENIYYRL